MTEWRLHYDIATKLGTRGKRPRGDFPLNNLALGVFSVAGEDPRCGVAIGDMVLDVAGMERAGYLVLADDPVLDLPFWNEVMDLGPDAWDRLRIVLTGYLTEGAETRGEVEPFLHPRADVTLYLPFLVSEYTDFSPAVITPSMWVACCAMRPKRCRPTGCIFPSATTGGPHPSWCRVRRCKGPGGRSSAAICPNWPPRRASIWNWNWGPWSAAPRTGR